MVNKIRKFADKNNLFSRGERVLVALSGGADSVCLLYVLLALKSEYELVVDAVHVNHMLRGAEAERDADFCKALCDKLGVRLHLCVEDVNAYAEISGKSIETAARDVRYKVFAQLKELHGYDKIAVAHHAQDNAETILMHLLRGSGLTGLRGILPKRDAIVRPLLEMSRKDILEFLSENNIQYVTDSTNAQTKNARNRIRHGLLAEIRQNYNPNIVQTLSETAHLLRADSEYIEMQAQCAYADTVSKLEDALLVHMQKYSMLPEAIALRVMKKAISECIGSAQDIPFDTVLRAHTHCLNRAVGSRVDLPMGAAAVLEHTGLYMYKHSSVIEYLYNINPGEVIFLEEAGMTLYTELTDCIGEEADNAAYFDYEGIAMPLVVRNRRSGDKIKLQGMTGSKKLKEYFIDTKIDKHIRDIWPLVCAGDEILWICGKRKSVLCAANKNTKKVLKITCEGKRYEI